MKQFPNLYDQLKPEVITIIENQKDKTPYIYKSIINCLKEKYFFMDLTLYQIHQIIKIDGIREIMETKTFEEGLLLTKLNNLLTFLPDKIDGDFQKIVRFDPTNFEMSQLMNREVNIIKYK